MNRSWELFAGAGVFALCCAMVFAWSFTSAIFQYGDNCGYMTLAASFAQGHGFTNPSFPNSPHALWWPPGFPAFLAALYAIVGAHWTAMTVMVLLLFFGSVLLFFRMMLRAGERQGDAAAVAVAVLVSSAIHSLSSYLYSETFCTALTLAFFWLWQRWKDKLDVKRVALLSIAAVYIASVRDVCLALPCALSVYLLVTQREDRSVATRWLFALPLIMTAAYLFAVLTIPAVKVGSVAAFFGVHPDFGHPSTGSGPAAATAAAHGVWNQVLRSIRGYAITLFPQALLQTAYASVPMGKAKAAGCLLIALIVAGGWARNWRQYPLINLYVLLYMGVLLVYGAFYVRLLIPITPFLLLYLHAGFRWIVGWLIRSPRAGGWVAGILWLCVIADNAWWTCTTPRRYMPPEYHSAAYQKCVSWIIDHAQPGEAVIADIPSYMYLRRGAYNLPFPPDRSTADELVTYCDTYRVRYIMVAEAPQPLVKAQQRYAAAFMPVFSSGGGPVVLRYDRNR